MPSHMACMRSRARMRARIACVQLLRRRRRRRRRRRPWPKSVCARHACALSLTISDVNRTRGGLSGYCSGNVSLIEKMPPSHAVSSVPKTVPPQTCRLSSPIGLALTPSGGDCFIVFRSDIRRRLDADDDAIDLCAPLETARIFFSARGR